MLASLLIFWWSSVESIDGFQVDTRGLRTMFETLAGDGREAFSADINSPLVTTV